MLPLSVVLRQDYIRFISIAFLMFLSASPVDLAADGCATYYEGCGNHTLPSFCKCKYLYTRTQAGNAEVTASCSSFCYIYHGFSLASLLESVPESFEFLIICLSAANKSEVILDPTIFRLYGSNIRTLNLTWCNVTRIVDGLASALIHMDTLQLLYANIGDSIHPALREVSNISNLILNSNKLTTLPDYTFCAENSKCLLKILNVAYNRLYYISKRAFDGLVFLERLFIGNNDLHVIFIDTLLGSLHSLQILNAKNNNIGQLVYNVTTAPLVDNLTLKKLDLSYNNIREWTCALHLPNLIYLNISYNEVSTFVENCFNMTALENLDVSYNKLTNFPSDNEFIPLTSDLTVLFEGNPLLCAFLLDFCEKIRFLKRNELGYLNKHVAIGDYKHLICAGPAELSNKTLASIPTEDIHCIIPKDGLTCPYYQTVSDYLKTYNCSSRIWENDLPVNTNILELTGSLKLSNITRIPSRFIVSDNILELYMSYNDITEICRGAFEGLPKLTKLVLNDNYITRISDDFAKLTLIEELFLNDNSIQRIDSASFSTNVNLTHLYLHNNQLQALPNGTFNPLKRLKLISLHNNKFRCGCTLLWLKQWINDNIYIVLRPSDIMCVNAYNGSLTTDVPILQLLDVYFNCNASGARGTLYATVISVITLIVFIASLLVLRHRKYIQWLFYVKYRYRLLKDDNNDEEDLKKYDAFISYSSEDYQVVLYDLAPVLEGRYPPYELCLHYRDFPVGAPIADTIIETVAASRRTILLLSPNFLESEWCLLEFKVAYEQVIHDRMNRLIVVLLEGICEEKLDKNLKKYLSTNSYIHWNDPLFWDKLYKLLPTDDVRLSRLKEKECDGNPIAV
ncbi:toll-like receptor Tollo, partial [Anneissia japonica]|uniref:toll-like receptor Tollo n=1 Tax=Anneissia japonica TaxID=1529436 RepID=UPI0014256A9E